MYLWLKSYLSDRTQYVSLDGFNSNKLNINYGVPQGSVLGPLLFLIYINDIVYIPNLGSKPKLFADDTNIFIANSNLGYLNALCQVTINTISDWLLANRLSINSDKTYYMIFSPFNEKNLSLNLNLNLTINSVSIARVNSIKFLGVIIDDKL